MRLPLTLLRNPLLLAALTAAVALVVGLSAGWFAAERAEDAPGGPVALHEPSPAPRAPTLVGVERTPAAAPVRATAPSAGRTAPAPAEPSGPSAAERMAALKADIQRTIEPEHWGEGSRWALEAHNGVLVAEAPQEVVGEILAFLDARRRALAPVPAAADVRVPSDAERQAALDDLQRLLLRLPRQLDRWEAVLDALAGRRTIERVVLLNAIAEEEPGHAWLRITDPASAADPEACRAALAPWVEGMRAASARLDDFARRWPCPTTWAALEDARRRAGLTRYARARAEIEPALRSTRVDLQLVNPRVESLLRHLQALSRIDIVADMHVAPAVRAQIVRGARVTGCPLGEALERLLQELPPGYAVRPLGSSLVLTRADAEPLVVATLFDVSDLLSDRPPEPATEPEPEPEAATAVPGGAAPPPAPSTVPR